MVDGEMQADVALFFFSSRRRHTRCSRDWSSDVCSSDLVTRVGSGPFPTEDAGPAGTHLSTKGQEVGTTTGRARRCGWLDAVLLRYAARINGLTELFLTKLDVLSGLPEVLICSAYRAVGDQYRDMPPHQSLFHKAEPVFERLPGWGEEIEGVRRFED